MPTLPSSDMCKRKFFELLGLVAGMKKFKPALLLPIWFVLKYCIP